MPALIERRKMTKTMYQALKRHIIKEREKKKQEQEADVAAMQREKQEAERRKNLEQENTATLEQTKEELSRVERSLENLRKEKSKLFAQLKRILENESSKKENEKKHDAEHQQLGGAPPAIQFLSGTGHMGRPVMFKPAIHHIQVANTSMHQGGNSQPMKRSRSPSPAPGMPNLYTYTPEFAPKMFQQVSQALPVYGGTPSKYPHGGTAQCDSIYPEQADQSKKQEAYSGSLRHNLEKKALYSVLTQSIAQDRHTHAAKPVHQPHQAQRGSIMTGYPVHSGQTQQPSVITRPHHPNLAQRHPFPQDRSGYL